jgi:hypothetical protein
MLAFIWLLLASAALAGGDRETAHAPAPEPACDACHPDQAAAFATAAMATAASGATFIAEWQAAGQATACLECHAPSGGGGVTCADCHGPGPHPYPPVAVPATCARCHDAAGENTLRAFLASAAARRGEDCLDCHRPGKEPAAGHRFTGPWQDPSRLPRAVVLRTLLETDRQGQKRLHLLLRHTAGHALPGGTTGRAIWLIVTATRATGERVSLLTRRFGWEHGAPGVWRDRTLPADRWTVVSVALDDALVDTRVRARLVYRFAPGPLDQPDPSQVILAETNVLPR